MEDGAKDGAAVASEAVKPDGQAARPQRRRARLDPIAAGLKALWADVENEPVPDDFLSLLDEIDAARVRGRTAGEESGT